MPYQIGICDDDQNQLTQLSALVKAWAGDRGHDCDLRTFPSAESFLFAWEDDSAYDILLLDVEMSGLSGIDLAKRIRQEGALPEIVFITSHFEFIAQGYEVDALHYLMKPVGEGKLREVLDRAAARRAIRPPSLVITCDGEVVRLPETHILYVEASLHYITIHTRSGVYKIKESLSAFEARLTDGFFRCHRSYLVSLKAIVRISRTGLTLENGTVLPLARGLYDAVNRAFIAKN